MATPRVARRDIEFIESFGGVRWDRPMDIVFLPDGESALVAEQVGDVYRVFFDARRDPILFISISERVSRDSNEEGLLSMALDPDFEQNGRIWMYYSVRQGIRTTRISWFTIEEYVVDWSSEHIIFELVQPYGNHNGGKLLFDQDGYLWLGLGDGGSAGDPQDNGQNLTNLFGTLIRIDVSSTSDESPYAIPPDNPFLGPDHSEALDEIWAYGLRNPWRMSLDEETGKLWIGDVGQSHREEINVIDIHSGAGSNFGWSVMEGNACFKPRRDCDRSEIVLPVHEYPPRTGNCAVTGGYVYRGSAIPELEGYYLYTDHCRGSLIALDSEQPSLDRVILGDIAPEGQKYDDPRISSFGIDNEGELYILRFDGPILKIAPSPLGP